MGSSSNRREQSHEIYGRAVRDQTLSFDANARNSIGPDATLERCRLELGPGVGSKTFGIVAPTDLVDCRIVVRKRLVNCQSWWEVKLIRCVFEGWYRGNDFGHWRSSPDYEPDPAITAAGLEDREHDVYGDVADCDFTSAVLDGCRFVNVDMSRVELPGWPHVVFLEPHRLAKLLPQITVPAQLKLFFDLVAEEDPQVSAVVEYVAEPIKKGEFSEGDLRGVLSELPKRLYRV
jgi:hypothetical protein